MSARVRYGIIGTGMMGCEHIRNLALIADAEVTAIADANPTSREWGRQAAGDAVAVYEDYRDLLRHAPVDAVVVATPNFTHFDVLTDVFRTRKHVLVEKPMCTTVEHCLRVVEAATRHPGVVWVGMQYRFMLPVAALIDRVDEGTIGVAHMIAIREHRFPFLPKVGDWNRFARNTGGTLVEKCCHFFDLMNLLSRSRPIRVYGAGGQDVNHLDERYDGARPDILDNAFVIVEFANGPRALLDLCMFAEHSRNEMELVVTGKKGKAEALVPAHTLTLSWRDRVEPETLHFDLDPAVQAAGFHLGSTYYEHLAFLDAVRRGGPARVSAADGALAVAVGAAAELSIQKHRPVELRELGL